MEALAERALAYARAPQVALAAPLGGVRDWSLVDSTTVRVRDALLEEVPGTGGYAAIKGPKVLSVGGGAPVHDPLSPARDHDSRQLSRDASWRSWGLLADLASARLDRLRACQAHGVRFVIRLQDNGKPQVDSMARGQLTPEFFRGTDLDVLLADDILVLNGRAIDAAVPVGHGQPILPLRRCGVHTPKGDGFFLTHLPPRIGPRQVADLYRGRWEVERSSKLDNSVPRLDEVDAERPCSLKTHLQASLIASIIAALLAHTHKVQPLPPQPDALRTEAPLHPRRPALQLAVSCQSTAQAFDLKGAEARRPWRRWRSCSRMPGETPPGVLGHPS